MSRVSVVSMSSTGGMSKWKVKAEPCPVLDVQAAPGSVPATEGGNVSSWRAGASSARKLNLKVLSLSVSARSSETGPERFDFGSIAVENTHKHMHHFPLGASTLNCVNDLKSYFNLNSNRHANV